MRNLVNNNRGSALVTVLVMITILTIITGTIMTTLSLQVRFIKRDLHRTQALYLAEAGIHKALWYLSGHSGRNKSWRVKNYGLSLFDSLGCTISIEQWGGYLSLLSTARYKGQTASLRVLVGETMPPLFQQAIVIGGVDYPLVVTGSNKIIGDVTVGSGGVKPGWIKGVGFSGGQLVEGKVHLQTPPRMPYFDASLLEESMRIYQGLLQNPRGLELFNSGGSSTSFQVFGQENPLDLKENPLVFVHGDFLLQSEIGTEKFTLKGPGTLVVSGDIVVDNGVKIDRRILLIAGEQIKINGRVEVDEGIFYAQNEISVSGEMQGSVQIFSPGDIRLAGKVHLTYPSVLYSSGRIIENRIEGKIEIIDQAFVEGAIIFQHPETLKTNSLRNTGLIVVGEQAQVTGAIYSSNAATIEGTVHGIGVTGKFHFYEEPTTYINWLKDATIDRSKLSKDFLLPLSFEPEPRFEILRWEIAQ